MTLPSYIKSTIEKNDPTIESIKLNNLGLDDSDAEEIFDLMSKNDYIKRIDLSYNNNSYKMAKSLCLLPRIVEINLSQNNLGNRGVVCLSENYSACNLKKLDISQNGLTLKSVPALKKLISAGIEIKIDDQPEILEALNPESQVLNHSSFFGNSVSVRLTPPRKNRSLTLNS